MTLAKVDATTNKKLKERFGVKSFPQMFWFEKGEHKPEYNSEISNLERTNKAIVDWVARKTNTKVWRRTP